MYKLSSTCSLKWLLTILYVWQRLHAINPCAAPQSPPLCCGHIDCLLCNGDDKHWQSSFRELSSVFQAAAVSFEMQNSRCLVNTPPAARGGDNGRAIKTWRKCCFKVVQCLDIGKENRRLSAGSKIQLEVTLIFSSVWAVRTHKHTRLCDWGVQGASREYYSQRSSHLWDFLQRLSPNTQQRLSHDVI